MNSSQELFDAVLTGNSQKARIAVEHALSNGTDVRELIGTMNSAMEEVGRKFSRSEIFLPEMMVAARAMKSAMEILEPLIVGNPILARGKIVIGTIKGDLHDIGKNLVAMMFKGAGFEVVDIGVDVSREAFLESIRQESPRIVAICALLTTVLTELADAVAFLRDSAARNDFKIMVGGAAVDSEFAERIGADGYADDAGEALQVAKQLLGIA
jgi:methanogenic corrinoid protein MtbC1